MADFVFPALCAFTRAEISAIFSASSKKESPLGLGFSKTSTEIEFAFTTKRCSMKAFKLLPCEAAKTDKRCNTSTGKSIFFLFFSISLSLCHKKALSLSFYLLYNRIYVILCRMLHRQLNHSGDIAFAHLTQLPDTRQPHFIITKEVCIL